LEFERAINKLGWCDQECKKSAKVIQMIFEVIGARSSVFADMPEGMICVGSPAKPVKPRVKSS